jgi:5-methylcytosine-specific restriction endonuclease McrA
MARLPPEEVAARLAARDSGLGVFESIVPCKHGHVGRRFTADRKCCVCNSISCKKRSERRLGEAEVQRRAKRRDDAARKREAKAAASADFRMRSAARQAAVASGSTTYQGAHCRHGHGNIRYTSNGMCTACAKAKTRAQVDSGYYKRHYQENAASILERQRACNSRNTADRTRRAAEWARLNPEKRRAISNQYKHRRRSKEGAGIPTDVLRSWTAAQPKVCFYCETPCQSNFHVDHFVPLAKGGAHVLTNLRISCGPCNRRKSARDPLFWIDLISDRPSEAA